MIRRFTSLSPPLPLLSPFAETRNRLKREFKSAIVSHSLVVKRVIPEHECESITGRFSHSFCCMKDEMYVFGGCTVSNTTFNDLWKLDLSTKRWKRMITSGSYPVPKAWASLLPLSQSTLILFGGWTHSRPTPLHETHRIFNHVHTFNLDTNSWSFLPSSNAPSLAAHSTFLSNGSMFVFGGLQPDPSRNPPYSPSNELWCFHPNDSTWTKPETSEPKPGPRYGHSVARIPSSDRHFLIMGGSGGPDVVFEDIWLLAVQKNFCTWTPIIIRREETIPTFQPRLHLNRVCQIGDNLVVMNGPSSNIGSKIEVNGRSISQMLRRRGRKDPSPVRKTASMYLSRLDIRNVLATGTVTWLPSPKTRLPGIDNLALYSLIRCHHELVMFGGIEKKSPEEVDCVSNHTIVIYSPKTVT